MTLRIHNIYYDHSIRVETYPSGVLTIDSTEKRIHVHDGFMPNGHPLPVVLDLEAYAKTTLENVSQEDITKLLTQYGALSLNDKNPITTEQRDNAYDKLRLDGLVSTATIPEKNVTYVDPTTKELLVRDQTTEPVYWGYDTTPDTVIMRTTNTDYTADRNCGVVVGFDWGGDRAGSNSAKLIVDGEELWGARLHIDAKHPTAVFIRNVATIPVYKGQTYRGEGAFTVFKEIPAKQVYSI